MYKGLFTLLSVCILACNSQPSAPANTSSMESEETLIMGLMKEQENAWNNADIRSFMEHYWNSDSLIFVGKSGVNRGWQTTLDNYLRSYPNPDAMGHLTFTNLEVDMLSPSNGYVIGRWELFRKEDTLSGHYSLLWKKLNGKWKIVADHSS